MNATLRALAAAALLSGLWACSEPPRPTPTLRARDLMAWGGPTAGTVGTELAEPLQVRVTNQTGAPTEGVTIQWAVVSGGGRVLEASSLTDGDGLARTRIALGPKSGAQRFAASAEGLAGSPVTFTLKASAGAAVKLAVVSGDGQTADATKPLPQPLVVRALDSADNPVPGASVDFAPTAGGGSVASPSAQTGEDGTASTAATLGPEEGTHTFAASLPGGGGTVQLSAKALPIGLVYWNPPEGGKLRLVRGAGSNASTLVLQLVTAAPLSAYSAGFNLPVDASKVKLPADALTPGTALDPGTGKVAAMARLPESGPMKNVLVTGLSQKASGGGAVTSDATLPAGAVLYSVRLELREGAPAGVLFDGDKPPPAFLLGARDRAGNDVVSPREVRVGKLEVRR